MPRSIFPSLAPNNGGGIELAKESWRGGGTAAIYNCRFLAVPPAFSSTAGDSGLFFKGYLVW